jgi:hypothetical protein
MTPDGPSFPSTRLREKRRCWESKNRTRIQYWDHRRGLRRRFDSGRHHGWGVRILDAAFAVAAAVVAAVAAAVAFVATGRSGGHVVVRKTMMLADRAEPMGSA